MNCSWLRRLLVPVGEWLSCPRSSSRPALIFFWTRCLMVLNSSACFESPDFFFFLYSLSRFFINFLSSDVIHGSPSLLPAILCGICLLILFSRACWKVFRILFTYILSWTIHFFKLLIFNTHTPPTHCHTRQRRWSFFAPYQTWFNITSFVCSDTEVFTMKVFF